MVDIGKVVSILWESFFEDLKSGDPVFFTFNRDSLDQCFHKANIETENSVELLNSIANGYIEVDSNGNKVELSPSVFEPISGEYSSVIILVCQQILAVEEMAKQEDGFSEHAYFPRLRQFISEQLVPISQNPFWFEDFEQLWRVFAKEIRSVPGSSEISISFRFDLRRSPDKAKALPLSQALLSRQDLLNLVTILGPDKIKKAHQNELVSDLKKVRAKLKRRPQRLLTIPFFRDRAVQQLISFLKKVEFSKKVNEDAPIKSNKNLEIRLFKHSDDLFSEEEFRACLYDPIGGQTVEDDALIRNELVRELDQKGALILSPTPYGDTWIKNNSESSVQEGDTFLICGTKEEIFKVKAIVTSFIKDIFNKPSVVTYFSFFDTFEICEVKWSQNCLGSLTVRSGRVVTCASTPKRGLWLGGTAVDNNRLKFLRNYLPQQIDFNGKKFNIEDVIKISDSSITYKAFLKAVDDLVVDQSFDFEFPDGHMTKLSVAVLRGSNTERIGFRYNESGKLSPTSSFITQEDKAFYGFEYTYSPPLKLSHAEIGFILKGLLSGDGIAVPEEICEVLKPALASSKFIPTATKKILNHKLSLSPTLPERTLLSLKNRFFNL